MPPKNEMTSRRGRSFLGVELNEQYAAIARERIAVAATMQPLADTTMRRIADGMRRYGLPTARPFVVQHNGQTLVVSDVDVVVNGRPHAADE